MYKGDFAPGAVLDWKFNSRDTDGAPITLAGTPSLTAYKDNGDTQDTSGLTLSVDFDSVTGLHNVRVDTSADGTFYSAGSSFSIVIAAGTVDSISVVGVVVGEFTLGRSAAFARLGAPAGASIAADIAVIEGQTDDIGVAGAGLTALATAAAVADLPTNAELTTALGTADDAVLAAIAALNDFDPATEEVLANVQKINDVEIAGDGAGTPMGVA